MKTCLLCVLYTLFFQAISLAQTYESASKNFAKNAGLVYFEYKLGDLYKYGVLLRISSDNRITLALIDEKDEVHEYYVENGYFSSTDVLNLKLADKEGNRNGGSILFLGKNGPLDIHLPLGGVGNTMANGVIPIYKKKPIFFCDLDTARKWPFQIMNFSPDYWKRGNVGYFFEWAKSHFR